MMGDYDPDQCSSYSNPWGSNCNSVFNNTHQQVTLAFVLGMAHNKWKDKQI